MSSAVAHGTTEDYIDFDPSDDAFKDKVQMHYCPLRFGDEAIEELYCSSSYASRQQWRLDTKVSLFIIGLLVNLMVLNPIVGLVFHPGYMPYGLVSACGFAPITILFAGRHYIDNYYAPWARQNYKFMERFGNVVMGGLMATVLYFPPLYFVGDLHETPAAIAIAGAVYNGTAPTGVCLLEDFLAAPASEISSYAFTSSLIMDDDTNERFPKQNPWFWRRS